MCPTLCGHLDCSPPGSSESSINGDLAFHCSTHFADFACLVVMYGDPPKHKEAYTCPSSQLNSVVVWNLKPIFRNMKRQQGVSFTFNKSLLFFFILIIYSALINCFSQFTFAIVNPKPPLLSFNILYNICESSFSLSGSSLFIF